MPVVREFTLPDLGEGLTEAEIVRWLVEVGDVVAVDQPVVEVETAKAVVEVPCPYGGVVTARFGESGDEVPVGNPLVTVAVGETASDGRLDAARPGPEPGSGPGSGPEPRQGRGRGTGGRPSDTAPGDGAQPAAGSGNVLVGYGTAAPAPRRRRVRAGTAPEAPPERRAAERTAAEGPVAVISPLVRRLAREHGVDLRAVRGSGADGLILRSDVERAIAQAEQAGVSVEPAAPAAPAGPAPAPTRIPLRGVRGAVAEKLSRSRREIPDATCWVDADATELLAARAAMNAAPGAPKISVLAVLARVCTAALARYPELNAVVDTERAEIVQLPAVHLGFAAQTERGLMVPVVRDAHARTTEELAAEIARLTEAARAGKLSPAELTGGTFTLNNYGVFGVDGSSPIINHPEAAMLGVGRITPKPWVHQGELAVRQVVQLSFTFDHRVCDGGTAGGFLRYVADCVEQPALLLRTV